MPVTSFLCEQRDPDCALFFFFSARVTAAEGTRERARRLRSFIQRDLHFAYTIPANPVVLLFIVSLLTCLRVYLFTLFFQNNSTRAKFYIHKILERIHV